MNELPPLITQHLAEVRALCEKYRVKRLTLFGSAVKGTFDPARSDLDFVVELIPLGDPILEGRAYLALWNELERVFGRRVDLVDPAGIANPYVAASINANQYALYHVPLLEREVTQLLDEMPPPTS